jgi:hypothetical protein
MSSLDNDFLLKTLSFLSLELIAMQLSNYRLDLLNDY